MTVLIVSHCDDLHALAVKYCLDNLGVENIFHVDADYPSVLTSSSMISNEEHLSYEIKSKNNTWKFNNTGIESVWLRRSTMPIIPPEVSLKDYNFVFDECTAYLRSFWYSISGNAFWVNTIEGMKRASNKLHQLDCAKHVGMSIPDSLMTNDIVKVKEFILNSKDQVIYKPFNQRQWVDGSDKYSIWACDVSLSNLENCDKFSLTPGIFQKKVKKKSELRIMFMGIHFVALRIKSQDHILCKDDWRKIDPIYLGLEVVDIPQSLYKKCLDFMKVIGIRFGIFDIIETPENDYFFLEVNEMGQFLWIEELIPDLSLLDMFIQFLLSKTDQFNYKRKSSPVFWSEVKDNTHFKGWVNDMTSDHIAHPNNFVVQESTAAIGDKYGY